MNSWLVGDRIHISFVKTIHIARGIVTPFQYPKEQSFVRCALIPITHMD